jgi:hypothetical protein
MVPPLSGAVVAAAAVQYSLPPGFSASEAFINSHDF